MTTLLGIKDSDQLADYQGKWVEEVLKNGTNQRDGKGTQNISVGDKEFVTETKAKLGAKAIGRQGVKNDEGDELKEPQSAYTHFFAPEKRGVSLKNDYFWKGL